MIHGHGMMISPHVSYSLPPKYPLASTWETPVVVAIGRLTPMKDLVRPCKRKVDTRGVADNGGNGTGIFMFDVSIMVDGVRRPGLSVLEGGKTNRVCEGVEIVGGVTVRT